MSTKDDTSACCHAPVVLCKGEDWDVPKESIRDGSTYCYGCTNCKQKCDLAVTDSPETLPTGDDTGNPGKNIIARADVKAAIANMLGLIDVDFGYAVGNLNMDTTPESRKELIDAIQLAVLEGLREEIAPIQMMLRRPKNYNEMHYGEQAQWVILQAGKIGSRVDDRITALNKQIEGLK